MAPAASKCRCLRRTAFRQAKRHFRQHNEQPLQRAFLRRYSTPPSSPREEWRRAMVAAVRLRAVPPPAVQPRGRPPEEAARYAPASRVARASARAASQENKPQTRPPRMLKR